MPNSQADSLHELDWTTAPDDPLFADEFDLFSEPLIDEPDDEDEFVARYIASL